jgi:hypothetical protein
VPRYRIIVTGTGMPDGYSGFATTRFVRAASEAEAIDMALALVATEVASEPAFSTSPAPTLAIDRVARVWSPFKLSRPNKGYCFVGADAELQDALHIERQVGTGWFL